MWHQNLNRRQWIKAAGAAGVTLATGMTGMTRAETERVAGLQLYTLRASMAEDVASTLRVVAEIGYREVEFAGYFEHSAQEIRLILSRYGLRSPSTHVPGSVLREDAAAFVATAAEIGHDYVTLAWMEASLRQTASDWQRWAEDTNRLGELCRQHGMRAAYHNHDFEFVEIDGVVPFELLLAETDPALVDFELDFYWAQKAGRDIRDVLAMAGGRVTMAHIKDMDEAGNIADVGAGIIDFHGILHDPVAASIRHAFVEHDTPAAPFHTVTVGYDALKAALE